MTIPLARKVDGKKFLWDGRTYDSKKEAYEATEAYTSEGFETQMLEEDGRLLVYSRRVATVQTSD